MKNEAMERYLKALKRALRCSGAERQALLSQGEALLRTFWEENPEADYDAFVAAFGPPDLFAGEMLDALPQNGPARSRTGRKGLFQTAAAAVAAVAFAALWLAGQAGWPGPVFADKPIPTPSEAVTPIPTPTPVTTPTPPPVETAAPSPEPGAAVEVDSDGTVWVEFYGTADPEARPMSGGTIAIKSDGTVWVWGNGLQFGNIEPKADPTSCAVIGSDGTVWIWGTDSYGQLGGGSMIESDGSIWTWGSAEYGQLDDGSLIESDGSVWTWGSGKYGQLDSERGGTA